MFTCCETIKKIKLDKERETERKKVKGSGREENEKEWWRYCWAARD